MEGKVLANELHVQLKLILKEIIGRQNLVSGFLFAKFTLFPTPKFSHIYGINGTFRDRH